MILALLSIFHPAIQFMKKKDNFACVYVFTVYMCACTVLYLYTYAMYMHTALVFSMALCCAPHAAMPTLQRIGSQSDSHVLGTQKVPIENQVLQLKKVQIPVVWKMQVAILFRKYCTRHIHIMCSLLSHYGG